VTAAEFDHALVAVADLEAGARRFLHDYRLTALQGGRHPGVGTGNRIVPLGRSYIELIAVVDEDEAAASDRAGRVKSALASGHTFAGWAARSSDLNELSRRLAGAGWGVGDAVEGSRQAPDGRVLRWRSTQLYPDSRRAEPGVLPFLIEWGVPASDHPGSMEVEHDVGRAEAVGLRFEDPQPELARSNLGLLLGGSIDFSVVPGPLSRLVAVELRSSAGPLIIA
jgi:hypothetical protein